MEQMGHEQQSNNERHPHRFEEFEMRNHYDLVYDREAIDWEGNETLNLSRNRVVIGKWQRWRHSELETVHQLVYAGCL